MIDCDNVAYTYDGKRPALDGVNLHVDDGEFLCILGGNGSGKSTLAKHINALLVPDSGRVMVDGRTTADSAEIYRIRATAGMVFQNPDDQLVASLVENDVAFGPENLGVETPELATRVQAALEQVGLAGFERHETHALSGGQKQRVAIAGVLAMQPKVLILDEASAMLDPRGRAGLMRVCRQLHDEGMTVIMITHFMEEAAKADRVAVLAHGKLACTGTPDEVLMRDDLLANLDLEAPFACTMSRALRKRGMHIAPSIDDDQLCASIRDTLTAQGVHLSTAGQAAEQTTEQAPTPDVSPVKDAAIGNAGMSVAVGTNAFTPSPDGSDATEDPDAVIEFQDVSYSYNPAQAKRNRTSVQNTTADGEKWGNNPDAVWALRNISFAVHRGEFFGIAGHTGSGKSTLIQHMNGLIHPTQGRVLVGGADVAHKAQAARIRADVGVVFQYPEHQLFADTVYNDVAFGPRNLKLPEDEVDARVRESLALVRIDFDGVRDMSPFALSGGQQRRVALAGVLAMRPSVLVLDEPAAGLDPAARRSFLALVDDLHSQGRTVVMISHNMDDLAERCDRLLVLNEGGLFALGRPQDVFLRSADLNAVGLGVPAAQRMANNLRAQGVPLAQGVLFDVESLANALANLGKDPR